MNNNPDQQLEAELQVICRHLDQGQYIHNGGQEQAVKDILALIQKQRAAHEPRATFCKYCGGELVLNSACWNGWHDDCYHNALQANPEGETDENT